MEWSKLFEWIKLPPKYLISIILVASVLLFSPIQFLQKLGIDKFANDFRAWIGILWLAAIALLLGHWIMYFSDIAGHKIRQKLWMRTSRKRLHDLTPKEKEILQKYFKDNSRSQPLPIHDGVVKGLEHARIIYPASNVGYAGTMSFSYNIQPWAWDYIRKRPELLEND